MEYAESCDKCERQLDQLKGEDIYLEKIDMVLCTDCHDQHKGIKVYY